MTRITVARALTARFARRILRLATLVAFAVLIALLLAIWALAHFFSPWWWLLLVPVLLLAGVSVVARLIVAVILSRIHTGQMTQVQSRALDEFIDKIEQVIEARATPPPIIALICIKDIIVHRDLKTVRRIISETTGLRRDYQELERLFT